MPINLNMEKFLFICILMIWSSFFKAQPFTFKSIGEAKEFRMTLYYGIHGKGAFVQYAGKKGIIPLTVKSYKSDISGRSDGQPDIKYYIWDEIIDGKVNGTYQISEMLRTIEDVTYIRKKDGRQFRFELVDEKNEKYDGSDQYLLYGALVSFNHFYNDRLIIDYPDGKKINTELMSIENPNSARQSIIEDYNFDGYDDLAFSVPDAGMGVYRMFSIYLYNPKIKRFEKLNEPDYSKSNCSCLCDVTVNKKTKLLQTGCRGGASWHQDIYRFDEKGRLKWSASKELKEE